MNVESPMPGASAEEADPGLHDAAAHQTAESDRRRRRIVVAGLIAVAAIGVWIVAHRRTAPEFDATGAQAPAVSVAVAAHRSVASTVNASGSLAARREMPVGSAGEGGQVAQVLVDAGQWVEKGQVLAVVDRSVQAQTLATNAAQIGAAQADARLAQANLDRALKLVDRGFISRADVDRLTATRDGAAARVRLARAQYGETGARLRRLSIVAPEAGFVLERRVEPGQIVGMGSSVLFRIALGGEVEMRAEVGEVELARIVPGAAATITPVGSGRAFAGKVWQVAPFIDPQTRQGTVRIALEPGMSARNPELRAGGFASAVIGAGTVSAPMLPDSAILNDGRHTYVFVVGPDNRARRRDVRTGLVTDNGVAIVAGLDGDDRVVLRAGGFLADGERVNPVAASR